MTSAAAHTTVASVAIVMTGGTSGFGAIAAERMAASGARLLLGARRTSPPDDSAGGLIPLDLASLDSVRSFATAVQSRLGDDGISALVLNAGLIRPDVSARTADGFETTFGVNHLAHYLLLRLLLPLLADDAIIVLTTSGTHDPKTRTRLTRPRHADAALLAHPERDPDLDSPPRKAGQHAYTASKLCALLTVRALSRRRAVEATTVAFCPGQVFGTGLAQQLSFPQRAAWTVLGTRVGAPLRRLDSYLNSRPAAAGALADLALGVAVPPAGRLYAALRRERLTWPDPSEQARRDELADRLWNDSARLVGAVGGV